MHNNSDAKLLLLIVAWLGTMLSTYYLGKQVREELMDVDHESAAWKRTLRKSFE